MNDLEELLRRQLARATEPDLVVPPDLARVLRRRAQRRRVAVPAATGALALAGAGTIALATRERPAADRRSVVVAATPSTPTPSPRQCSVPELLAAGGPKSMVEFRWPSGATLVLLHTPEEPCPIELMLSSTTLDAQDVQAAERRWGSNVRLVPYDVARLRDARPPMPDTPAPG